MSSGRRRFLVVLGCGMVAVGGTLFVMAARALAAHFQFWENPAVLGANVALTAIFLTLTIWGAVTIRGRGRRKILMQNMVLLICVALTPILGEGVLRVGIAYGPDIFRTPNLYADPYSEADFYKLRALWETPRPDGEKDAPGVSTLQYDARLGWSYPRTAQNPLGILSSIPYPPQDERRAILFYGDSFVAYGHSRMEDKIPQIIDRQLQQYRTHNYGVSGFGLDQIYLRFQESVGYFQDPIVFFGLLTYDIDRCLLEYRSSPKPYFKIEGGELVLQVVPVTADSNRYLEEHPVEIKSFFVSAVVRTYWRLEAGGTSNRSQQRRAEKEILASKILEAVNREARAKELDLVFVLFSGRSREDWRRDFLLGECRRLQVNFFDVQEILLAAESEAGREHQESFDKTGHHSLWANAQIARGISDYVLEHFGSVTSPAQAR